MKSTFLLEIKRIFSIKNILIFLLFFILTLYLLYFGISKYKNFLEEIENFLDYENLKVRQYINYEQYGSFGFRVLLQPSPLIIFTHSALLSIESTVNIKDIVNISSAYKGQKIFFNNGMEGDFSTSFFILGSLLMLIFGLNTFVSIESLRFHRAGNYIINTLCCRLIVLNGYFSSVIIAAYLLAKIQGIPITGKDTAVFCKYSLYLILFINLFYFLGIFLGVVLRFKKRFIMSAYLVWFIIIFIIPLIHKMDVEKRAKEIKSNEIVNIKKLNNGKDFERKSEVFFQDLQEKKVKEVKAIARQFVDEYIKNILPLNKAIEDNLNNEVSRLIIHYENQSVLSPSSFYCFLSREFSGTGYYGYRYFLKHILELKDGFYRYYFNKRYNQIAQVVEPFEKNQFNIFRPGSILPANFEKGLVLTSLYSLLLLGGALYGLHRKLTLQNQKQSQVQWTLDIDQMEMGKTYFCFSRDRKQTGHMFNYLESIKAVIIEKIDPLLYDPGTSLKAWVEFEAHQKGIGLRKVLENLEILGVTGNRLKQKIKNLDNEDFNKAYLGLELAREATIYVFDDFLNRGSKEFEQVFKEAIDKLKPQAIILYFSEQMFDITVGRDGHLPVPGKDVDEETRIYSHAPFVAVDLNDVSLR